MAKKAKIHQIEVTAPMLGNFAWARLQRLMDEDLAHRQNIDGEAIDEAETMLMFLRAISDRADYVQLNLTYEKDG